MANFTAPPIWETQNESESIRLLAAQRQSYSDAKMIHFSQMTLTFTGGILVATSTFLFEAFRPVLAAALGCLLLGLSVVASSREKRKIEIAASIQEKFDTEVFQLNWSRAHKVSTPSASEVARAALRHRGGNLNNWYSLNQPVNRPLDVLICQRANLGWGIATHRAWAATVLCTGLAILGTATVFVSLSGMPATKALLGVYIPLLPAFKETGETWLSNSRSAALKEEADLEAAKIWNSSMQSRRAPTEQHCRKLQDKILESRMTNSLIPDWFNGMLRNREESVMKLGTSDYVNQAKKRGLA
ncbi:hypothetical protein GCM10027160_39950 [Streptomyces calidiresistens]|uniref:Uncharacterized protein n=1 Tax=Streptomyces calidiresistens TaxID=1485586 RepID=A0A7W3T303_9ACTN|nr:S-4TM family putative pore-forming effector [Streptomyces calidiresistens]MBB0230009.1 hypothetical protein [Streptomyces calidiresistens]